MTIIKLVKSSYQVELLKHYPQDVIIHSEDLDVVKGHKLILAMGSSWFHKFFISNGKQSDNVYNLFFFNIRTQSIKLAIDLIYGKELEVTKEEIKKRDVTFQKKE